MLSFFVATYVVARGFFFAESATLAADTAGQSFPPYLLQVTALSVAMAWLYANTRAACCRSC